MQHFVKKPLLLLFLFTVLGGFLRFSNLAWGEPHFFHPDERNIAGSISQLSFPTQMNPNFFAYGSLPIYTIYFIGVLLNVLQTCMTEGLTCVSSSSTITVVRFEQALVISRFISALFSTILIPILYSIGKKLYGHNVGLWTSFFGATSVGFLQFAHFGTFEMWTTFFGVLLFLVCIDLSRTFSRKKVLFASLLTGVLVSTKVTNGVLLALPFLAGLISLFPSVYHKKNVLLHAVRKYVSLLVLIFGMTFLIFLASNPFAFTSTPHNKFPHVTFSKAFLGSMKYESEVALGTMHVFYTHEFINTYPVVFHFLYVYPFLTNPLLTLAFLFCFFFILYQAVTQKKAELFLLWIMYCLLFFSQAFVHVKWVRYMVPTLPFLYLMIGSLFTTAFLKQKSFVTTSIKMFIIFLCMLFAFSYAKTVLFAPDTRVKAAEFAKQKMDKNTLVITEIYDMGIVPFNEHFQKIILCNFYDAEVTTNICNDQLLSDLTSQPHYVILPSQRILKTRLSNPTRYPLGHAFYVSLRNPLMYTKIYETPCDLFCRILYLGNQSIRFEQTANVFDRPPVVIYEKNNSL